MRADRLLGDAGDVGQLGRGQRLAGHQCREDLGARVVADQRGDADDAGTDLHGSMLAEPSRAGKEAILHCFDTRSSP